jgi:MGT family glycosyltransferase
VAKIAVVHVPFYSHIHALTRLTRVLVHQGHTVTAFAPEPWRRDIEGAGAAFEPHNPETPHVRGHLAFAAAWATTTERCSEELVERLFPHDVDLLIHDSQTPWARVAGDYLGLPRIISHPMFPIIARHHVVSEHERNLPEPDPGQSWEQFEAAWRSISRRFGVEIEDVGSVVHSSGETTIAYTTETIVGGHPLEARWKFVGPLMDRVVRPTDQPERPLVYVCLGTSFNTRPEVFRAIIEGLAEEPVDVLVSLGGGLVSADDLEPLPPNVRVEDFVETREALTTASVHITHGGCNSTHESLMAGVPMVFIPQAFDQFPLARRAEVLGSGLRADEDPRSVRAAVRLLLQSDKASRCTQVLQRHLEDYDGETVLAGVIERELSGETAIGA